MVNQTVFILNDMLLELIGLKNVVTAAFINNATVTVTLVDKDDVEVVGQAWPTTMTFVTASNGDYRATLQDVLALVDGDVYIAQVTADGGAGLRARWDFPVTAKERKFT